MVRLPCLLDTLHLLMAARRARTSPHYSNCLPRLLLAERARISTFCLYLHESSLFTMHLIRRALGRARISQSWKRTPSSLVRSYSPLDDRPRPRQQREWRAHLPDPTRAPRPTSLPRYANALSNLLEDTSTYDAEKGEQDVESFIKHMAITVYTGACSRHSLPTLALS